MSEEDRSKILAEVQQVQLEYVELRELTRRKKLEFHHRLLDATRQGVSKSAIADALGWGRTYVTNMCRQAEEEEREANRDHNAGTGL